MFDDVTVNCLFRWQRPDLQEKHDRNFVIENRIARYGNSSPPTT